MRLRCEYCDSWIDDTDEVCPHCGAPNAHLMASAAGVPKTIEELKAFAVAHNLPLADMRFFIGEDYREPRAFGIYQDGENFVVYKNKANGQRAIRYEGHDEAYAVNELYQKMKSEVANQKSRLAGRQSNKSSNQTKSHLDPQGGRKGNRPRLDRYDIIIIVLVLGVFFGIGTIVYQAFTGTSPGYYTYEDTTYYHNNDGWYRFDTTDDTWVIVSDPPTTLTENHDDYYTSYSWDEDTGVTDFEQSPYYHPPSYSSDDDGDDRDWDSGWDDDDWDWDSSDDWDTGSTDWDSDW